MEPGFFKDGVYRKRIEEIAGLPVLEATLYVDPSGNDSTATGTLSKPYATIQAALAQGRVLLGAGASDVVVGVYPGTYTFDVGSPVDLDTAGLHLVAVNQAGEESHTLSGTTTLNISGYKNTLDGFFVSCTTVANAVAINTPNGANAVYRIENCYIYGADYGLSIDNADDGSFYYLKHSRFQAVQSFAGLRFVDTSTSGGAGLFSYLYGHDIHIHDDNRSDGLCVLTVNEARVYINGMYCTTGRGNPVYLTNNSTDNLTGLIYISNFVFNNDETFSVREVAIVAGDNIILENGIIRGQNADILGDQPSLEITTGNANSAVHIKNVEFETTYSYNAVMVNNAESGSSVIFDNCFFNRLKDSPDGGDGNMVIIQELQGLLEFNNCNGSPRDGIQDALFHFEGSSASSGRLLIRGGRYEIAGAQELVKVSNSNWSGVIEIVQGTYFENTGAPYITQTVGTGTIRDRGLIRGPNVLDADIQAGTLEVRDDARSKMLADITSSWSY